MFSFFINCGNNKSGSSNQKDDIYIYQIKYGETKYEKVSGFARVNGIVYYLPNDSNLLLRNKLPENSIIVDDAEIIKMFDDLNIEKLASVKEYDKCNCKAITKNEYIIRIKENGKFKDYIFTEIFGCESSSPCKFLEDIYNAFKNLDK